MKSEELKVTKQMVRDSMHRSYGVVPIKKAYCDLHDCCEVCNPRVRFWCKVIVKIEDLQTRIINKLIKE